MMYIVVLCVYGYIFFNLDDIDNFRVVEIFCIFLVYLFEFIGVIQNFRYVMYVFLLSYFDYYVYVWGIFVNLVYEFEFFVFEVLNEYYVGVEGLKVSMLLLVCCDFLFIIMGQYLSKEFKIVFF